MNARNENEKPREARDARTEAPVNEPFEAESQTPQEATDARETVEGGYGWGV